MGTPNLTIEYPLTSYTTKQLELLRMLKTEKKIIVGHPDSEAGYILVGEETRALKGGDFLVQTSAFCGMPLNPHGQPWLRFQKQKICNHLKITSRNSTIVEVMKLETRCDTLAEETPIGLSNRPNHRRFLIHIMYGEAYISVIRC